MIFGKENNNIIYYNELYSNGLIVCINRWRIFVVFPYCDNAI